MGTVSWKVFTLALVTIASVSCRGGLDLTTPQRSIGVATMDEHGTVVLTIRAESGTGLIGDSQISFRPDDARYQEILNHVGGLKPGEEKEVPPWADD
jgi:hypothetical protein